jgi:hypothetical protein
MSCDELRRRAQTKAERKREVDRAIEELERAMAGGRVYAMISAEGAIAFPDWEEGERAGISDACAYRLLDERGSWELQQAVEAAESLSGYEVNVETIAAGVHSHDGGKSWGSH